MTDDAEQTDRAKAREALIGRVVAGRYAIRALIGAGGMGAVYEAEHLELGKAVAIKFVDPEWATDDQVVARFAREARVMSRLDSAHVVTVFDAGTAEGRPYIVMELLRGEDLGNRLRRKRTVPRDEAMHVVAQVLKGLSRAHAAGIVHRDLKPDNVFLLARDGDTSFAKIVDFGMSKIDRPRAGTTPLALTGRGTVIGTPFYMAPEQAQAAADVDGRADLYSVGAILFECLTGRPPHTGESYEQVILSICMRDAPDVRAIDPSIPEEVAAFVARALSRQKDARFPNAEIMLAALHEIAPAERTRVPLDVATAGTMLSAGGVASGGPGPLVRVDPPSVATRVGVASLDDDAAASSPAASAPVPLPASGPTPGNVRRSSPSAPGRTSDAGASAPPRRRGFDRSLFVTAGLATIAGVGVTLGVIHFVGARGHDADMTSALDVATEPSAATSAANADEPESLPIAPSDTTSVTSATDEAAEAGVVLAPVETPPTPTTTGTGAAPRGPRGGTTTSVSAGAGATKPEPKPSRLDIQRDLP